jgi:hypothetical protein
MPSARHLNAKEKALFDFWYDNDYEARISDTEASILALQLRRSKTFRFIGVAGSGIILPYPAISEVEPIVAINGQLQAIGHDFTMPSAALIEFDESLIEDDVVTVYLTYMEVS